MKVAVSYFGCRVPRVVASHMEGLARRGVSRVVHTFSENDLRFYAGTMKDIVSASHDAGLEVMIDPWGVARIFGGEAFSQWIVEDSSIRQVGASGRLLAGACPNNPRTRQLLHEWIDAASATGADWVFWDEPHWVPRGPGNPLGEICVCKYCMEASGGAVGVGGREAEAFRAHSMESLLEDLVGYAQSRGLRSSVCVLPEGVNDQPHLDWEKIGSLKGLEGFGTDPYWEAFGFTDREGRRLFLERNAGRAVAVATARGLESMLWVQAFKIPASREQSLLEGVSELLAYSPDVIALWGFECCAHMSYIACERPEDLWERLLECLLGGS